MEDKYKASKTNTEYKFPGGDQGSDSERSLVSLESVLFYDLRKQNDDKPIDENDQLVELLLSIGKMERESIKEFVEY